MYQCCSQLALQSREPDFVLFPHFQLHASLWMAPPSRHLHTANSTGTLLENSWSRKKRKPRVGFLCHATTHPDRARCARAQARAPRRQMGAQGIMLSVPKETHSPCRSPPFCHQTTASSGWKENGCRRAGAHEPLEAQNKLFTAASLRHFPQDSHASCAWTCCCCLAWQASMQVLNTSREGNSATSLGSLFHSSSPSGHRSFYLVFIRNCLCFRR